MEKSFIIVFVLFVVLPIIFIMCHYNKFITLKNYIEEAFSTMDVYLKKRWDLIPNLVEITKGYMQYENSVLEKITQLRNQNYGFLSNNEKLDVNNKLSLGLSSLIATAENYPDLKANSNFNNLMSELSNVEEDIANSRKYYNGTVREYNTAIQLFPAVLVANIFNFKEEKLFEINTNERNNVEVKF